MMNRTELLKKLLPGFIPLFVFIIADEIWGTKIGLYVAVAVGVAEFAYVWIKDKRFDKFILLDTLLLVALGAVSILLDNDVFFKLKPGLIEIILVAVLGVSAFSPLNIIGLMSQRYMKDLKMSQQQISAMRQNLKVLFFVFLFHTALVFYATFFMSKEAWAFISGGLFYILFGIYFIIELARQKLKNKSLAKEEWVPIVDKNGKITGQAPRSQVHNGSHLLHPVVHLHVIHKNKAILLQKRPMNKLIQPGKWDTAVGGHISAGETLDQALKKEAYEELGLNDFTAKLMKTYVWKSEVESELVYMFVSFDYKNPINHSDEVDEARFWTKNQIQKQLGNNIFTPNLEHEFKILQELTII